MACHNIMTVLVNHRTSKAPEMQKVLTESGCIIKMRLGLHNAGDACSEEGLIILQLSGERNDIEELENALNNVEGVTAKHIEICSE